MKIEVKKIGTIRDVEGLKGYIYKMPYGNGFLICYTFNSIKAFETLDEIDRYLSHCNLRMVLLRSFQKRI